MSDRSRRIRELSEQKRRTAKVKEKQMVQELIDEFSINNRMKRILFDMDGALVKGLFDKANGICNWCGNPFGDRPIAIDHIFPIAKGGTNNAQNLQILHADCNRKKTDSIAHLSHKEIIEFYQNRLDQDES